MANESAKGSKAGRVRKSQGHIRYNQEDRCRKNRVARELKNLRENPNDGACFNRIRGYLGSMLNIPVGNVRGSKVSCYDALKSAYDGYLATHGSNAR